MKKYSLLWIVLLGLGLMLVACGTPDTSQTEESASTPENSSEEEASVTEEEAPVAEKEAPEPVTLTFLVDDGTDTVDAFNALIEAFEAEHPNITIELETRPGGSDGDNIVKTRLATGEMTDVFAYNSGSLFQALRPEQTLVDLTGDPMLDNVADAFFPAVTAGGKIYGVPSSTAFAGGVLYNARVYEELGLSVPLTWEEFAANNEAIKEAGLVPMVATFGDTWTSQLLVLADYYNVEQANPNFAEEYTNNQAKYATTPAALASFQYLQEGFEKGWYQEDFATDTLEQGLQLLADGAAVHYPMLSIVMGNVVDNNPDKVDDIGFFALPGKDASQNGATIWVSGGAYIAQTSEHIEEAKQFLAFMASPAGADAMSSAVPPTGPYMITGVSLPEDSIRAVKDVAAYIESGNSGPALEFVSPIKGPALEQLCVAVGSGQMTAEEAASAYDEDVKKQAQQLGLEGWDN